MTDELTARMHAAGDNLELTPAPPAVVRARAEHRRRGRRLSGVVIAVVIALLAGTGGLLGDLRSAPTVPADPPGPVKPSPAESAVPPARTPAVRPEYYELVFGRDENVVLVLESSVVADRPHVRFEMGLETAIPSERGRCPGSTGTCLPGAAEARSYSLAAEPAVTRTDLNSFESLSSFEPHWTALPTESAVPTLTTCVPDPAGLAATQSHVAAFETVSGGHPEPTADSERFTPTHPGYLIETVLLFDDEAAAAHAYSSIRDQALRCDYTTTEPLADGSNPVPGWPVDEFFAAAMTPAA